MCQEKGKENVASKAWSFQFTLGNLVYTFTSKTFLWEGFDMQGFGQGLLND
jgi:hypothetical protein